MKFKNFKHSLEFFLFDQIFIYIVRHNLKLKMFVNKNMSIKVNIKNICSILNIMIKHNITKYDKKLNKKIRFKQWARFISYKVILIFFCMEGFPGVKITFELLL